ncbi:Uncharacterized protein BXIN_1682 [Babesia sp. Xinjiang]|uniref:Uncharacterized protein n=1 Tax=Babesia sp. Xinjiang TaxID=462227 RepID=UPI000A21D5B4|nr:Uncharacterized protein BXIN_1737 [Babesia sp. Xinjiang]XP_028871424.1 Uncharacterized protein BXIN_1682 [Babesia sp. Xinjiang]ORM40887.1 Uncharacterized protein BXIN_1737 [Babesia sp. Xinjiang]ORM40968.1 Uncharacterized protein BXIN_1682 [Babesia sp. Xinjiang]
MDVLTFHGLNAAHSAFDDYSDVLSAKDFTVVSYDIYGHGLSEIPNYDVLGRRYSLDFLVDQAEDVISFFKLEGRKITVIGISMGGCIAAAFCERHPEKVERIILISPAGLIPKCSLSVRLARFFHCFIPCVPLCVCRCCFPRKNLLTTRSKSDNHMLWRLFVTPKSSAAMLGILKRVPLWSSDGLYQRVGALKKPTLIVFGGRDVVTPPTCAMQLHKYFLNSHVIIFPNACHLASYMIPTHLTSTCLAFLHVPPNENVSRYIFWLPFGPHGEYICRENRRIIEEYEDDVTVSSILSNPSDGAHIRDISFTDYEECPIKPAEFNVVRHFKFYPGENVGVSPKTTTLFALAAGRVKYTHDVERNIKLVNVLPEPPDELLRDDLWRYRTEHVSSIQDNCALVWRRVKSAHYMLSEDSLLNPPLKPPPRARFLSKNDPWNNQAYPDLPINYRFPPKFRG